MGKKFFKHMWKRCFAFVLAAAVTITQISPSIAAVTAEAAENDNEPYVISAGRPAYASSHDGDAYDVSKAFDGDEITRWQALKDDTDEWIYTDLGKTAKITKIYLSWQEAAASKYRVQFSDDEVDWKTVYEVVDGKKDDKRTLPVTGEARYVRIQCDERTTGWGCSLFEFQVYGLNGLAQRPPDYGKNLALGKETKASSARVEWWMRIGANNENWKSIVDDLFDNGYPVDEYGNLLTDREKIFLEDGYLCYAKGKTVADQRSVLPKNAVDGKYNDDCWQTKGGDAKKRKDDQWMYVDLGAEYEIGRIILKWKNAPRAYRIEVSDNASDWTPVYSNMNGYEPDKNLPIHTRGRYVRVYCIAPWDFGSGFGLSEIEVYEYRPGLDEDITYNIEQEPVPKSVSVPGSDATYATDDIRFPMAKPPVHLDESLQMPDKPVASNDWWQTITIKDIGDGLVALPYRTKYSANGLDITEVNDCWYEGEPYGGSIGTAVVNSMTDITLSPEGINASKIYDQIVDYSDFAIKAQLCDADGPVMTNTIVKGSPYIFSEFEGNQDVVIYSANITSVFDNNGKEILTEQNKEYTLDHFGLEVTDNDNKAKTKTSVSLFCITLPAGTKVKKAGNKIKIHFQNKNGYMSVGAMTRKSDLKTFYNHGYTFVTDTSVTYDYDEKTSKITTHYKMETELKRLGFNKNTIQCLFPHQYKKLLSGTPVDDNWSYVTSRGTMKGCVLDNNQFETHDTFYGMVPQFTKPQDDEYEDELITKYLSQIEANTHNIESLPGGDAYWQGKSLHPLALATLVADQNGNTEYRDMFLERLRYIFDDWFTYSGQDDEIYFYYDKNWGTLYYRYSEFGANWGICDHHFTYGYFLFAAAVLATYDDVFYEQYKEMLDLIVRDFASPYDDDELFCRFRSFDLYEGHSWAGGYADNETGNNQEAGGESLFGWVGMYLWSIRSGNEDFRDASIFGFTTELNDVEQYWFNYDGDNWPEDYPHYIVGQNYGATIFYGTFFDGNSVSVYGIHWLPVTEWISHYSMGEKRKTALEAMYEGFLEEIDSQREHEKEENKSKVKTPLTNWQHIFVPLKSQFDPDGALNDYWQVCNGKVQYDGGTVGFDSTEQFNAYWFAHSMKDLGNKTDEIWPVGGVSASVYKKGDTYTALAWNPTEDDMVFKFTDGEKIVGSATIGSKSLVRFNPLAKDIVQVSTPEFSLASDTYEDTQYLKITTTTEGATIHYTTDGSNPTEASPIYNERIPVSSTTTIKAVALKDGYIDSKMESVTITIDGSCITTGENIALGKLAEASSGQNSVSNITDGNATSRWETQQENDTYNDGDWCTIDLEDEYTINKVKISWEAAYASKYKIQVSTDNQTWTDVYTENTGNGGFDEIVFDPAARYVRMQGVERGSAYGYSIYEMGVYKARQIAIPQFSLQTGTYNGNQMLSIASGTKAVEIRYTTDGTEPTQDSPLYIPRLTLWQNVTIKAKAFKLGMLPSETAEATYIINGGTEPDADKDTYDENDPFQPQPEDEIEEEPIAGETAAVEDPHLKTCISYQKDVYVSSSENDDTAKNITDGNEDSGWSSAFAENGVNFSDEKRFDQWCYIDLGESVPFNEVKINWVTTDNHYKIQVSDDAKDWKDVYISTKNTDASKVDICSFDTINARYVKMQGIKVGQPWGYSLKEIMVYLSDDEQPLGQNVGVGIGITNSSNNNNASHLNDGNTNTIWTSENDEPQSIELNLFKTYQIDKVVLNGMDNYNGSVTIKVSADGKNWTTVIDNYDVAKDGIYKFNPSYAKYVKAEFSTGENLSISEFEVYTVGSADVAKVDVEYYNSTGAGASTNNSDAGKINDNDLSSRWQADKEDKNAWCYIDLGEPEEVNVVSILWEASYAEAYDIYLTDTIGDDETPVFGEPAYKGETGKSGLVDTILTNPATARYVVLCQTVPSGSANAYGCSLFEMKAGYRPPVSVENIAAGPQNATLTIGQTLDAVCIVSPSNADDTSVTWKSSDNSVATVSSKGVIKGKKAGTAVITVTSNANDSQKAEISISVIGPLEASRPKAEKTGDNDITITWTGDENAIGYNIYRSKSQNNGYEQLNNTLLTTTSYVDSGLIKGTYYYKVEFIADEENTVYRNSEQSTQSTGVTIELSGVNLALDASQHEIEVGKSITINAFITPANIAITWKSSDKSVATVRNGVIKGIKEGTTVVTAKAEDKTVSCTVNVINVDANTETPAPVITITPKPIKTSEPADTKAPEPIDTKIPEPTDTKTSEPADTKTPKPTDTKTQAPTPAQTEIPKPTQTKTPEPTQTETKTPTSGSGNTSVKNPVNIPFPIFPIPGNTSTSKPGNTQVPVGTLAPVPVNTPVPEVTETPVPTQTTKPVQVTKLELSAANRPYGANDIQLTKKGKLSLNVNVIGEGKNIQKVKWSSSNSKVVSVNSKGVIKAKNKTGTAVITAQSVADNTQNASIKVTVVAKKIANKVLKLKENKAKLDTKGQKAQIEIKKYTKETTDLIRYKVMSGNKYIRVNKYGKITCKKKPNNKNAKAKIRVKCGTKKKIVNVTVSKKK